MGSIAMTSTKSAWIGSLEWSYSGGWVTVTMYTGKTDGYPSSAASGANFTATITVGGSSETFYFQQQETDMTVGSVSVPVSGNTVTIHGRVDAPYGVSMYGYPLVGSGTVTLYQEEPVDAQPSQVTISATRVQMGKTLQISIRRLTPGVTHRLNCWFASDNQPWIADKVDTGYLWTVPDYVSLCPDVLEREVWVMCYTYDSDGNYVGYTEQKLTLTVPDATTPSVSGGEMTLGTAGTVNCSRNSESFSQVLQLEFKGNTYDIASGKIDSASWTPGYDLAKLIPTLTSGTGTLKCTTYNGTALVGTGTATVKLLVPDNSKTRPSFKASGLTLSPVSDLPDAFAGLYIRGKTGLKAQMTASSAYSTIAKYQITVGSLTAEGNPAVISQLVNEGAVKVTAKVTDARGYSTSVTATLNVLPYRNPRIVPYSGYSAVICERAEASGALSSDGTYLAIRAGKDFSSVLAGGKELNSCTLRYRWKISTAASFGSWNTLLAADSSARQVSVLVGNIVTSLEKSYLVELEAADALGGTHTITFQIMTEAVSFVLYDGPDGAGFGKYPEAPHVVDIASHMTLLVRGKLMVASQGWQDLGLASGMAETGYNYGRQKTAGCHMLPYDGSHVYLAFDCGFSYSGSAKIINASTIPAAYRPHRKTHGLCPVNDRGMAMVSVDTDGYIRVEWIQKLTDSVQTGSATVTWLDGYLDYWI